MIQAMQAGIAGMKAYQQALSVTSNNIANASTTAFKKQQAQFTDLLYTNTMGGSISDLYAATNPKSIGSGSKLGAIHTDYSASSATTTDGPMDAALTGDGFFVVGDEEGESLVYTRNGSFSISPDGYIVNANGQYVLGFTANEDGDIISNPTPMPIEIPQTAVEYSIGNGGKVILTYSDGSSEEFAQLAVATFPNNNGLLQQGDGTYTQGISAGEVAIGVAGENGSGGIIGGALEASNVDLGTEFVDLMVYQKGFQGSTKIIKISDDILNEVVSLIR